jgi:hypothetical protein
MVFSEFADQETYGAINDAFIWVGVQNYRDKFVWGIAHYDSFCELHPNDCPIVTKRNYTVDTHLFIPEMSDFEKNPNGFPETVSQKNKMNLRKFLIKSSPN